MSSEVATRTRAHSVEPVPIMAHGASIDARLLRYARIHRYREPRPNAAYTITVKPTGRISYAGERVANVLAYQGAELCDRPLTSIITDRDIAHTVAPIHRYLGASREDLSITAVTLTGIAKNGTELPLKFCLHLGARRDGESRRELSMCLASSCHNAENALHATALFDEVTMLPNHALFTAVLNQDLETAGCDAQFYVFTLAIENLKLTNHQFGSPGCEQVLKCVSSRLRNRLDDNYFIARVARNMFAIAVSDARGVAVAEVAESLRMVLNDPISHGGAAMGIAATLGCACNNDSDDDAETLLFRAREAMTDSQPRFAGKSGQDTNYLLDAPPVVARRRGVVNDIHYALEHRHVDIQYQPQFALRTGKLSGMEALVRLNIPGRLSHSPTELIAVAEQTGLILPLGELIFERVCVDTKVLCELGLMHGRMAVNFSAYQFLQSSLVEHVASILARIGLAASNFEFEITESAMLNDEQTVVETMRRLNATGIRLAIDDFGSGYAPFTYLKRYPVDVLKIDVEFVAGIDASPTDREIVSSIIQLGHGRGLEIVAEGVETRAQLDVLRALHCDYCQGNFLSGALRFDDLTTFVQNKSRMGIPPS